MVTRPAPALNAPRAASRPAPVVGRPPDTTTAWPREYLWPPARGRGNKRLHNGGRLAKVIGLITASTLAGMPISATWIAPQAAGRAAADDPPLVEKR